MSCGEDTVSRIKSNVFRTVFICSSSFETMNAWAPSFVAASRFDSVVEIIVTCAPIATPNLTAI